MRTQHTQQARNRKFTRPAMMERLEGRELFSTYLVTSLADGGTGSLRQEIASANAHAGADVIQFKAGLTGTIGLTSGQLKATDSVNIEGPGASKISVSGSNIDRVFYLSNTKANVTISGLTITKGNAAPGFGGGIINYGKLTLSNDVLTKNTAGTHATAGGGGGGGALMNYGNASITDSTFNDNTAIGSDSSDTGGGAIFNAGTLSLSRSAVWGNRAKIAPGMLPLFNVPIAGVGGIYSSGSLTVTNSTFAYNTSGSGSAGAVLNTKLAAFINCTIVHNNGGYMAGGIESPGTVFFGNDIIAQNTCLKKLLMSPDIEAASYDSFGHNLIGVAMATMIFNATDLKGTLYMPLNPNLNSLAFNGGPTETIAPAFGSPAYNGGSNSLASTYGLTTDQRGFARVQNGITDIGAYESSYK